MKHLRLVSLLIFFFPLLIVVVRAQDEPRAAWQVLRYEINATLPSATTAERTLTARAVLNLRNVGQGAGRTLTTRINPAAEVTSISVGEQPARFLMRDESRTRLRTAIITLPAAIAPGQTISAAIEYKLPLTENTGTAAVSVEGSQFLPLASWYPTPNSPFSPRGTDTAPVLLKVNAPGGDQVISSGQLSASGSFEQKLFAQPFFLTGKWETIEGAGEARGVSAHLLNGATAGEKKRAEELIALAAAARAFYAGQLGVAPDAPIRLVAVRRGAGFDMGGTALLDASVFRRQKLDAVTALLVAESVARIWIGGQVPVRGEGAGVVREGLPRFLATQFLEKQFGREAADAERLRQRIAYVAVARRDAPLAQTTALEPTYFLSVANKGAMVWRLAERSLGREAFAGALRGELQGTGENRELSLIGFRAALSRLGGENFKRVLDAQLDQPTETDLLVGQPQQRGAEWITALRNNGPFEVVVSIAALTDTGERIIIERTIPARDFAEAQFKTTARLTSAEIDPDKLYPQLDYANDAAPHSPAPEEALDEATRALAAQEFARAEDVSRKALRRTPLMQELRTLLGRALLEQNKLDEAERELRRALDELLPLPSTLAWANIGLGEIAVRRNGFAEAAKFFQEAIASEGGYAPTLQARASRLKAEASGKVSPAPDETVRAFFTQFDAAIKGGRKVDLDALVLPGELINFAKGIVGSQPELWQTRVLRTEALGTDRLAADVAVSAKVLGREQSGAAVFILARSGGNLKIAEIPIFEVR